MTQPLTADSPRRAVARRFGSELRRAMAARGATVRGTAEAIGLSRTLLHFYRDGVNLPRIETAERLSVQLDWPKLSTIALEARTGRCELCSKPFLAQGSGNKRYCSEDCRRVAAAKRVGISTRDRAIVAERRATRYALAIDAYCRACEPDGMCRMSECQLRSVSPLPLLREHIA